MAIRKSKDRNKITRTITTTTADVEIFNRQTKELEIKQVTLIGQIDKMNVMRICGQSNVVTEVNNLHYATRIYAMTIEDFIKHAEVLGDVELTIKKG